MPMYYIASTEKNKNLIREDILIQDFILSKGLYSKIETLDFIAKEAKSGDFVFLKSIWGYYKDFKKFLEQASLLKEKGVTLVNDYEHVYWNINKSEYFSEIDFLDTVPTYRLEIDNAKSIDDIRKIIQSAIKDYTNDKFVIKPSISASGYLTYLFDKKNKNTNHLVEVFNHKDLDFMIQPFRSGITEGEISIVLIQGKIQYGIKRFPGILTEKKEAEYINFQEIPQKIIEQVGLVSDFFCKKFKSLPKICRVDFVKNGPDYEVMEIELIDPDLFFRLIPKDMLNKCLTELIS